MQAHQITSRSYPASDQLEKTAFSEAKRCKRAFTLIAWQTCATIFPEKFQYNKYADKRGQKQLDEQNDGGVLAETIRQSETSGDQSTYG